MSRRALSRFMASAVGRATPGADASGAEACEHLAEFAVAAAPDPVTPGRCQECADDGVNTWAHLRMCLACGHVGCCDSSPHQHATEHFHQTGHPVMRSVEPGEDWRWCYVDLRMAG